jgi:hypothetical protein
VQARKRVQGGAQGGGAELGGFGSSDASWPTGSGPLRHSEEQSESLVFWLTNEIHPHPSPWQLRLRGGPSDLATPGTKRHVACVQLAQSRAHVALGRLAWHSFGTVGTVPEVSCASRAETVRSSPLLPRSAQRTGWKREKANFGLRRGVARGTAIPQRRRGSLQRPGDEARGQSRAGHHRAQPLPITLHDLARAAEAAVRVALLELESAGRVECLADRVALCASANET